MFTSRKTLSANLMVRSSLDKRLSIGWPPSLKTTQSIENKQPVKLALRKIFHLRQLDIKVFIRNDLREEICLPAADFVGKSLTKVITYALRSGNGQLTNGTCM
jgi:hypothetical protein